MSIVSEKRRCICCGKWYSFNPDVGKIECPRCRSKAAIVKKIEGGKKNKLSLIHIFPYL